MDTTSSGAPMMAYARGAYNEVAPFSHWHHVVRLEEWAPHHGDAITECGISFHYPTEYNTFTDANTVALTGGDRCTQGCVVPERVA